MKFSLSLSVYVYLQKKSVYGNKVTKIKGSSHEADKKLHLTFPLYR